MRRKLVHLRQAGGNLPEDNTPQKLLPTGLCPGDRVNTLWGGTHHKLRRAFFIQLGMVEGVVNRKGVVHLPTQGDAVGLPVQVLEIIKIGVSILVKFVTLPGHRTKCGRQGSQALAHVTQGIGINRAFDTPQVIIAHFTGELAAKLPGGLLGDKVYSAAGGVTAVQRPLGAAQHLDSLEFRHIQGRTQLSTHIDAVQIHGVGRADRQIAGATGTDTAHIDAQVTPGAGRLEAGHVGQGANEVTGVDHAASLQVGFAQGRDGNRYILGVLRALLGGNHHLFKHK